MSAPKKLLRYQGDSFGQLLTVNDRKHNLSGLAVCVLSGSPFGPVCTENLIRVDEVLESPKLAE
jgi:hypothetical protein